MGTGKTSVGRRLASQLRMRYIDTDDIIERDSGRRISNIFSEDGEPVFRDIESEAVHKASKLYNYVISTGGGAVLRETNMAALKRNGIIFCLTATPDEIYRRVRHQAHRPLLQTSDALGKNQVNVSRTAALLRRSRLYGENDRTSFSRNHRIHQKGLCEKHKGSKTVKTLRVELGDNSYPIIVGSGFLARVGEMLTPHIKSDKVLIVSDVFV